MDEVRKNSILDNAKEHVKKTCSVIAIELVGWKKRVKETQKKAKQTPGPDKVVLEKILSYEMEREDQLDQLSKSPYFVRCDVRKKGSDEQETWYFSKFSFKEESIFSWVTRAAAIRFENPGSFTYVRPDGLRQEGDLVRKDQYMIVDGKILFLSTEAIGQPRELVHQEYFSTRKTSFELPEIVAQMEKAQDQVVRADHRGPFVISGPAGSGKTTLALHRVAYLVQAPETMEFYPAESIIVFVQDDNTKAYFSNLLPELGITNVKITTFAAWAMVVLSLEDYEYMHRYGSIKERDQYEYAKLEALRSGRIGKSQKDDPFKYLKTIYSKSFGEDQMALFEQQADDKVLDRFDLTVLLEADKNTHGEIGSVREYYLELKNGTLKKKIGWLPFYYSLEIVDEFQNYLPEQLRLMKSCVRDELNSILYVGELAQQIQVGTIQDWTDIDEKINEDRSVLLSKVYRNTKEILGFIKSLGYEIEIPKEVKGGGGVVEKVVQDKKAEIEYVKDLIKATDEKLMIGVLAKEKDYLKDFEKEIKAKNVHFFSIQEAQGVEFETVCLVGVDKDSFRVKDSDSSPFHHEEKERILKNLLYLALTRAMSELYVVGSCKLSESR